MLGGYRQKQGVRQAVAEVQGHYSEMLESAFDPDGRPQQMAKPFSTTPATRGDMGEMERFAREFMNKAIALRNDYGREMQAIGWSHLLEAKRLKGDKTLAESKLMVKRAKRIVKAYAKKNHALFDDGKVAIRALNIGQSAKRGMIEGFEGGLGVGKAKVDEAWGYEYAIVEVYEKIFNLLSSCMGRWTVAGDQILFDNDEDLEQFNSYMAAIQGIVEKQEAMQRQGLQMLNQNLDQLKGME